MKQSLFLLLVLISHASFGQFTIDSSLRTEFWTVFERLPEKYKKEKDAHFKKGLGLLTTINADTLNKNEYLGRNSSEKDPNAVETGKPDPKVFSQGESISEQQPMWLSCNCRFKGDTLEIISGISIFSGFDVTTSLFKDKAKARYTEYESEKVFKTSLESEM